MTVTKKGTISTKTATKETKETKDTAKEESQMTVTKKATKVEAVKTEPAKVEAKAQATKIEAKIRVTKVEAKAEKVEAIKKVSNTQRCANMILDAAKAATATRKEVEATMVSLFPGLSKVSIKTLLSDLQNAKYAKRYAKVTIAFEDTTGKIKLGTPIAS